MSLVAFGSVKGSPGATTAVLAVAACWPPGRRVILIEADPAGGDLAARFSLTPEPGLVSLASASRHSASGDSLLAHTQELPDRLPVVLAPASAAQSTAALAVLLPAVSATWRGFDADVLVDCGRLDAGSRGCEVLGHADLCVVVARPELADLKHLAEAQTALVSRARSLLVLLVGAGPYTIAEVADAVGASVIGKLPHDAAGAALLAGRAGSRRRLARTPLMRGARAVAALLASLVAESTAVPSPELAPAVSGNGAEAPMEAR